MEVEQLGGNVVPLPELWFIWKLKGQPEPPSAGLCPDAVRSAEAAWQGPSCFLPGCALASGICTGLGPERRPPGVHCGRPVRRQMRCLGLPLRLAMDRPRAVLGVVGEVLHRVLVPPILGPRSLSLFSLEVQSRPLRAAAARRRPARGRTWTLQTWRKSPEFTFAPQSPASHWPPRSVS